MQFAIPLLLNTEGHQTFDEQIQARITSTCKSQYPPLHHAKRIDDFGDDQVLGWSYTYQRMAMSLIMRSDHLISP